MQVTDEWQKCWKRAPAFVRLVKGEKERADTREGVTHAIAEHDYVMCGEDLDAHGAPDETNMYPIKKETFRDTYILEEHSQLPDEKIYCRDNQEITYLLVRISKQVISQRRDILQRLHDYEFNTQRGQTILDVIGDPDDQFGTWEFETDIKCQACGLVMDAQMALSHFTTSER
jgi:hypothetical protein